MNGSLWVPVDPPRLEANWRAITAELDAPAPSRIERWLRRAGIDGATVRLVVATPALRRSWYVAVALVVVLGLAAADRNAPDPEASLLTLLVTAPLLPVLGVALAYGPGSDPDHEATMSTPLAGLRLVLIRAVVVLAVSTGALAVAGALSPVRSPWAWAWLLPSLATTAWTLALSARFVPRRAAGVVAGAWVAVVVVARAAAADRLAPFGPAGQVVSLVAIAAAAGVLAVHRDRFTTLPGRSR